MRRTPAAGYAAIALTVLLWAGFALSTRAIAHSALTPWDVALIRFGLPLALLAPWLPRAAREVRAAVVRPGGPTSLACLTLGAGLPFFLLAAWGGKLSSAAHVGVVIPGMAPLFVAAIGWLAWRQRITPRAAVGLAAIVAGVAALTVFAPAGIGPEATAVLVLAGLLWALYTTGLKRAGLTPIAATLALCVPNAAATGLALATGLAPSGLTTAPPAELALFALAQGLGVGTLAALAYATAIRSLGPQRAAAFGAASPVVTVLAAVPLFAEPLTAAGALGTALVVAGVVRATTAPAPTAPQESHVRVTAEPDRRPIVGAHPGLPG